MARIIDELDTKILELLQDNARITQSDIAKAVGMAPSAVLERMRKLEARGAIREYVASIDPHVAELPFLPLSPSAPASTARPAIGPRPGADSRSARSASRRGRRLLFAESARARRGAPWTVAAAADCLGAARDVDAHHRRARDDEGNESDSARRAQAADTTRVVGDRPCRRVSNDGSLTSPGSRSASCGAPPSSPFGSHWNRFPWHCSRAFAGWRLV